jgi:hypothetical protein
MVAADSGITKLLEACDRQPDDQEVALSLPKIECDQTLIPGDNRIVEL